MSTQRRFVRLVDSISGRFDDSSMSDTHPSPMTVAGAPDLDAYMRSFMVEIYDWSAPDSHAEGHAWPTLPQKASEIGVAADDKRGSYWEIRIIAVLGPGFNSKPLFGMASCDLLS